MRRKADRLLEELLSLYARYRKEEFEEVFQKLAQGELERLLETTRQLALQAPRTSGAPATQGPKKRTSRDLLETELKRLRASADPKHREIASFLEDLAERRVLPTPNVLRSFLQTLDWPADSGKADRPAVARRLGEHLDQMTAPAASEVIERARRMAEGSLLQSWADVIVKR